MRKIISTTVLVLGVIFYAAASDGPDMYVKASSTLKGKLDRYRVQHLSDRTWATWCEGEKDDGIGTTITMEKLYSDMTLSKLYVKNGFGLRKYWKVNNRVKDITIENERGQEATVTLKDTADFQTVTVSPELKGSKFTLTIKSVYRGTKYRDTCISELSTDNVSFNDTDAFPEFKKLVISVKTRRHNLLLTLKSDGSISGQVPDGQCPISIDGDWTKRGKNIRINYYYTEDLNCGNLNATRLRTVGRSGTITLVSPSLDALREAQGREVWLQEIVEK